MIVDFDALKSQYDSKKGDYEALCIEIKEQISHLLEEKGVKLGFAMDHRVKTWDSILGKIEKYDISIQNISEINDVAGIRIVTLFKRDIGVVCGIIDELFNPPRKEDTHKRLSENEFGYGSIHYELSLPDEWTSPPTKRRFRGLFAEVQVRTGSQHIWAASSHLLQYKNQDDVPQPLRRTINRVAALLETVDLEFERVLEERIEYKESGVDDDLNVETLMRLLEASFPAENKDKSEPYSRMVTELSSLNVTQVSRLKEIINKHYEDVIKQDKIAVETVRDGKPGFRTTRSRVDRGVFYTFAGLLRSILVLEFGENKVRELIRELDRKERKKESEK